MSDLAVAVSGFIAPVHLEALRRPNELWVGHRDRAQEMLLMILPCWPHERSRWPTIRAGTTKDFLIH